MSAFLQKNIEMAEGKISLLATHWHARRVTSNSCLNLKHHKTKSLDKHSGRRGNSLTLIWAVAEAKWVHTGVNYIALSPHIWWNSNGTSITETWYITENLWKDFSINPIIHIPYTDLVIWIQQGQNLLTGTVSGTRWVCGHSWQRCS